MAENNEPNSRLHAWVEEVDKRVYKLETQMAIDGVKSDNIDARLSGIESTLKWLVRLIIGILLVSLVGLTLRGGVVPFKAAAQIIGG